MKIGIDVRLWSQTGVGRYTRNLVTNLVDLDNKNDYVLFVNKEDENAVKKNVGANFKVVQANIPWHGLAEQIKLPKILNQEELDLVHFPYFSVPIFYYKPFVVTVHDLIVNKVNTGRASTLPYPLYMSKRLGYHAVMANAIYRSKKIIVPSKAVAADIKKSYMNVDSRKIEVTYEGGFEKKLTPAAGKVVEGDYLLRVGNFYPHKNLERLLAAFKNFLYDSYENHNAKLVLVGKRDFFYKKIEKQVSSLNLTSNVVFVENPSDEKLISLYENAIATVVPSLSEGFSLTTIEAMDSGCPVVASDIPVHREICGSAAVYCNPYDLNDIKQKIDFVFSFDQGSRKELISQGKKQAKKFSWKEMAKETLQIYQNCV